MRALQALVIVMGVLLIAGTAVIAVTIVRRLAVPGHVPVQASLPAHVEARLPKDARIVATFALGDRLAVQVSGPDSNQVLLVDPATGAVVETIGLVPAQ